MKKNTYIYVCVLRCLVMSDSLQPHRQKPTRLFCPWNFPGKNTGMGCHFLHLKIFGFCFQGDGKSQKFPSRRLISWNLCFHRIALVALLRIQWGGLPSSGWDLALLLQGAWVPCLVGKLRCLPVRHGEKKECNEDDDGSQGWKQKHH